MPANHKEIADLRKTAGGKMSPVLTDEQREQFKELEGEEFDLPDELRGPGQRQPQ